MPETPSNDIQVMISYRQLESLLSAATEVKQLRYEVRRLQTQQSALRLQFSELMEELRRLD